VELAPVWQAEDRRALFLYLHVPFCEMRCGFCNLFARSGADEALVDAYLAALEKQARVLAEATAGARRIARLAVGGGTPTFLSPDQLERLFDLAERWFGATPVQVPTSVETSPKTATEPRLQYLRRRRVQRVSIGVQSFVERENQAIGRPQALGEVMAALERLRDFPVLNVDLIYGQPGQTLASWLHSVRQALRFQPDELYLYPLYVRPGTGVGRRGDVERAPAPVMRRLYREARDLLLAEGYEQVSMRFFQAGHAPQADAPTYCCQSDGMVGLGCGARSYTSGLHYSSRFAVEPHHLRAILDDWIRQSDHNFCRADWGYRLCDEDRQRRFVIQSLLTCPGLCEKSYQQTFRRPVLDGFPQLVQLADGGFVEFDQGTWRLTPLGLELSDAIGPSLYSPANLSRLERFARS
jgi:oxygen-independent coproporphyrinogen-3 oxidase